MERAPQTLPAVAVKPIAPPRLKKQLTKAPTDSPQGQQPPPLDVAEKPGKKPPPSIAPYSSHQTGDSPQVTPSPALQSNGQTSHSVPVAKVEGISPTKASPRPPPKPPRRTMREKVVPAADRPSPPRGEEKGEEGGEGKGPPVPGAVDSGRRVVEPYLVVDILDSPTLSGEGLPHPKTDAHIESPSDLSSHPSLDSTHSSSDSTHLFIDPTQPPMERPRRHAPPPPKRADRLGETSSSFDQSVHTDPAAATSPPTSTASKCSPSGFIPPSYPAPPPPASPSPAQDKGDSDSAVDSTRSSNKGVVKGNSSPAVIIPESPIVEKQSTVPRPRRKAPPPPKAPPSPIQAPPPPVQAPSMPTDPLSGKNRTGTSPMARSRSLPRPRKQTNSSESKYATLQAGSQLRGQPVDPPAEKEKKGKLQLRGWFKKLSGSPSSKKKLQDSSTGSGTAVKKGTAKKRTVPSSLSCDNKLAEAGDADCYAVVGGSQPATPSVTPGEDLHRQKVLNTPTAPAVDTPTSDTNAYASIDVPTNSGQAARRPGALQTDQQMPVRPAAFHEPVYAAVNKKKRAARKVSEEAPAVLCETSSSGLYEEVVVLEQRRVGTKVVRQSSKLRLSRALSAESFNLEDFDEEEAVLMWGGRVITPVSEAEDVEQPSEDVLLDQEEGVSLSENEAVTPNQEGSVTPNQEGGVTPNQEGGVTPNQEEGVTPSQEGGVTPSQEGGVTPSQEGGVTPSHEGGVTPSQEGGVTPNQEGDVSPEQDRDTPPKPIKRLPPPVPIPYAKYKELQKAGKLETVDGADTDTMSSLRLPSPSHCLPCIQSAPDPLRGTPPSELCIGSPGSPEAGQMSNLHQEDEEDDTDLEDDSDEDDDEDAGRPKRYHIAKEILKTERTFVQRLTLLDQDFRGAVDSYNQSHDRPVVSEETMQQILANVGSLRLLNTDFLDKLEERFRGWDACPRIGDIMSGFAPYLKMYSEYISKFDNSLKVLNETMKRNQVFFELVKEFEAQPRCANLSVANYMLETVQRIPRYQLLLQDYIKHLPEDSDDIAESQKALDCIARVAQDVNESMRQMDNFKKLVEIEKKLVGDVGGSLITPTRKLLKEGEVTKFSRKECTPRMIFLFSDILLYATTVQPPSFTSYKVIKRIPLLGLRIEDLNDPEVKHGFQIISTSKSFRLEASSEEDKKQWLKLTRQAIRELEEIESTRKERRKTVTSGMDSALTPDAPLGQYAPPWLPDSCVSMCMACTASFTMTRRRHHCRACGNVFCHQCTSFEGVLQYKDSKMERVCQTCYETLRQQGVHVKTAKQPKLYSSVSLSAGASYSSVLQEIKARDQSSERSGYLLVKGKRGWKRKWFVLSNLALYSFAKHEDRAAKESIIVPSHVLVYPFEEDPLQFCLKHSGTGTILFKGDDVADVEGWVGVLQMAARGESSL